MKAWRCWGRVWFSEDSWMVISTGVWGGGRGEEAFAVEEFLACLIPSVFDSCNATFLSNCVVCALCLRKKSIVSEAETVAYGQTIK